MGSFNMTCAASQQTIAPRDPCHVLGLLLSVDSSPINVTKDDVTQDVYGVAHKTCHYDGFWRPVGNFIEAQYDDYGCVAISLDNGNRDKVAFLFHTLLERGWVTKQGDNQYHDLPFDLHAFIKEASPEFYAMLNVGGRIESVPATFDDVIVKCWEYMWDATRAGRVFLNDYMGIARPFEFTIVQKAAYNALADISAMNTDWHGVSLELDSYLRHILDKAVAALDEDCADWELANKLREGIRFADGVGYPMWELGESQLRFLAHDLATGAKTKEEVFAILRPLVKDRYALGGYTALNLRLTPAATASQDYHNQVGRDYSEFIGKVSTEVSRMRLERMYDPFKPYRMRVLTRKSMDQLVANMHEVDAAILNVSIVEVVPGILDAEFECTASEDVFREAIAKFGGSESNLMLESLHLRRTGVKA